MTSASRSLSRLSRPRIVLVLTVAVVVGAAAGILVGTLIEPSYGVSTAASVALGLTAIYALLSLRAQVIAGWALRRAFRSLGLLVPSAHPGAAAAAVVRDVPVHQCRGVAGVLDAGRRHSVGDRAVLRGRCGAVFLVPRLAQELDAFDDSIVSADLLAASQGTPLEAPAQRLIDEDIDLPEEAQVTGLQMVNLVLVLVIAQAVQVLLLALAVFGFFMIFGAVAIDDTVIESWTGDDVHHVFGLDLVSQELVQVSVFLAAFSGLYFTVYAITDELYRKEFFTTIMNELRRAVGARVVYRALRAEPAEAD